MSISTERAEECARGQDAIKEASKLPGYRLIAKRCAATLRSLAAERDALLARVAELDKENEIMASLIDVIGDTFNHAGSQIFEEIKKARAALGEKE